MNGVLFGNKHSYRDWGLFLAERPLVSEPQPKTMYIDIPASNGSIDLTESLTGEVNYYDRKATMTFLMLDKRSNWAESTSIIADYLHGQRMKIWMDEDLAYYYEGRFQINSLKSDKAKQTIVIEGTVYPFKYEKFSSLENWLWDDLNFETGIIREYRDLEVNESLDLMIVGRKLSVTPIFYVSKSSNLTVTYNGTTYNLKDGSNRFVSLILREGENTLTFKGSGVVSVDYRGGRL